MPQLWTETFVSQYFWLLVILFTFYYFITTKVIPAIANAIKARQLSDNTEKQTETIAFVNDKSTNLFNTSSKQEITIESVILDGDLIQQEWLTTNPEQDNQYWIENNISEESKDYLNQEEDNDTSLEEFLQSEEN